MIRKLAEMATKLEQERNSAAGIHQSNHKDNSVS